MKCLNLKPEVIVQMIWSSGDYSHNIQSNQSHDLPLLMLHRGVVQAAAVVGAQVVDGIVRENE